MSNALDCRIDFIAYAPQIDNSLAYIGGNINSTGNIDAAGI
jgi:hypothetical protein